MPNYLVQTILKTEDGNPENYVTNTWAWQVDSLSTDAPIVEAGLLDFYNAINPIFSDLLQQSNHEFKWYLAPGVPPNYPERVTLWSFNVNPGGAPLPSEVALCLSFQASIQAGLPQARRRGRVYLGPLDTPTLGSDGRPETATLNLIAGAATGLLAVSDTNGTLEWGVYSRVTQTLVSVNNGWIDNSYDTQRRRGVRWDSRALWPTAP